MPMYDYICLHCEDLQEELKKVIHTLVSLHHGAVGRARPGGRPRNKPTPPLGCYVRAIDPP